MKTSKRLNKKLGNRSTEFKLQQNEISGIEGDYQLQILNNIDDHVYLTDPECNIHYANSSFCYFHQKQPSEIIGQNLREIKGKEKYISLIPALNRCLEGETITYHEKIHHPEGRDISVVTSHYPYYDSHGLLTGVITLSKITGSDSQHAEDQKNPETENWQDKYELITLNTSDVVWILNLSKQKFTFFSPSVYQMTGYTPDEAKNMGLHESLTPDSANYLLEVIPTRLHEFIKNPENKKNYYDELRQPCKNGELIWIESSTQFRFGKQGDIEIVGISRNITRRKRAEIALKESENKLSKLLEKLPGGIFQYRFYPSDDYKIEFMSKWAEALFEKPVNDLLNPEILYKNIHPDDLKPFMDSIKNAYTDLTPWFNESRLVINDKVKWIRGIAISENQDDGSVLWNGVLLDVTKEKTASMALEKSKEKYKALNTSIREMLHLPKLDDIYSFITTTLHEQYPDTAVIFASVNQEQTKARILKTAGIPKSVFTSTLKIAGFDIFNREFNVLPNHFNKYKSGELVTFERGFADFVGNELSSFVAIAIEKLINIPKIYGIGINNEGKLFGIIYFFSKNQHFTADSTYLESFLGQAGIVINRKMMEESLRRSEEVFRNLVENQGEGVGITDQNEVFTFANPAAHQIFGVKPAKLINASLKSFLSPESQLKVMHETTLRKQGKKSIYEIEIIQPEGKVVPLLVTVTPQYDDKQNFTGSFGVFRDISETKHAEMLLRKNEEHYRTLSASATDMLLLKQLDDIYKYITETLHKHLPGTIVLFNLVNEDKLKTRLLHINGVSNKVMKSVLKLNGENIIGKEYNLLPKHHEMFKQGRLISFEGGLEEFASTEMPRIVSKSIEKLAGIEQIYSIGINKADKLYAAVHLFTMKKNVEINQKFVESFVKQAGIVIERNALEQSLKISEEKFSSFLGKSSDAILLTDEKFNLIYLNKAFEVLTGYHRTEIANSDIFDLCYLLLPANEKKYKDYDQFRKDFLKQINDSANNFQNDLIETQLQAKQGKIISVQARFFNIRTSQGDRIGAICRDVTDQKAKEKTLQELNATKDRLFSIIGHDLKNPLNNIIGFTQLMDENYDSYPDDKLKKFIGIVNQSASSLSGLLDNLLLWSHTQRKKISIEPVDISFTAITNTCFDLLQATANKKQLVLRNYLTEKHVGYADHQMMITVLRNLLANAIKFTPKGGKVSVAGQIKSDKLVISVADSGVGMDTDTSETLFEPTMKYSSPGTEGEKGTGLGLIICKEFIEKNNGEIWVESEMNKGSTFYFSIPLRTTTA